MESMTASTNVVTDVNLPVKPEIPEINTDPAAFQTEISKIAAEMGTKVENGNVVKVEQPVQAVTQPLPQAATQPIPEKFQTQNGDIDQVKVEKSTLHAEEALRRYQMMETELRKKQNEVRKLEDQNRQVYNQQAQAMPPMPYGQPQPYQQFQYLPDQINAALEQTKNPGQVIAGFGSQLYQAVKQDLDREYQSRFQSMQDRLEMNQRTAELQAIAEKDSWVFTEDGMRTLNQVRQSNPWIDNSPKPWTDAYKVYIANRELNKSLSQVQPNPQASQRAPVTPVGAANRTPDNSMPSLAALSQDPGLLNATLDKMNQQQRDAFFASFISGTKAGST